MIADVTKYLTLIYDRVVVLFHNHVNTEWGGRRIFFLAQREWSVNLATCISSDFKVEDVLGFKSLLSPLSLSLSL
jgi:hypothetical protein